MSIYRYSESTTQNGQVVRFAGNSDEIDEISQLIKEKIKWLANAPSHTTNVGHGGCGRYSRYNIVQHEYAGGMGGYIEVLEIKDPPNGHHGVIVNCHNSFDFNSFSCFPRS